MKSKLGIVLLLFALNFDGAANKSVGAGLVPARVPLQQSGQGQALPLQNNSSPGFSFATLNPDGNPIAKQRHKKHRQRHTRRRAKVAGTSGMGMGSGGSNANTAAPTEEPMVGASPTGMPMPKPPIDVNKKSAPAPSKSAPGIKPPTVQIKPPTR